MSSGQFSSPGDAVNRASKINSQNSQFSPEVRLQVGERHFTTTADTLAGESGFFASLFSGRWGEGLGADKPLLIDADGDLFEHILRYLRRGVLPIFYDKAKGHDHALYLALLEEAKFFAIPRLENWLLYKKYLQAVRFVYEVNVMEGCSGLGFTVRSEQDIEYKPIYKPMGATKREYVCPRAIPVHKKPSDCGKECAKKRGAAGDVYVDVGIVQTMVIRKETVFDTEMCLQ